MTVMKREYLKKLSLKAMKTKEIEPLNLSELNFSTRIINDKKAPFFLFFCLFYFDFPIIWQKTR